MATKVGSGKPLAISEATRRAMETKSGDIGKAGEIRETKRSRWVRLGQKRVRRVLAAMRVFSNCSNRGGYEYTDAEVDQAFAALQAGLDQARTKFKTTRAQEFSFTWSTPSEGA